MYRYPFSQLFYNSLAFSRALGGVIYQVCVLYKHSFFVKTTWVIKDHIDRRAELPIYVNVEKNGSERNCCSWTDKRKDRKEESLRSQEKIFLSLCFVFQGLFLALITACTILGNLFIILTILSHSNLRRPSHLFIASLASTDLLLGLTVMVPR